MSKRKLFKLILLAIIALLVLNIIRTRLRTTTVQPKGVIGLSVLTLGNPFFKDIADAMQAEAAKYDYEVIVESGDFDPAKQKDQVSNFIVQKVNAIVLCPCDSKSVGSSIAEANKAGIPVFTADIACLAQGPKVVCHIASDNQGGGRQAAKAVIEAIGGRGTVAIIDHPEVESVISRTKGFVEELARAKAADGVDISIVARVPGHGEQAAAFKAAEDILQTHPDLDAFFAINDPSAMGAVAAIEKAGKGGKIKIVGFDGNAQARQAIKDGQVYADAIQHPDEIGRKTVEVIMKYMAAEELPPEILIPTSLYRKSDADKDTTLR
jgi:ribose transport system substrate-binding protein